jgi:hypothetical protein
MEVVTNNPIIGGPPIPYINYLHSSGSLNDIDLYDQTNQAVRSAIIRDGSNVSSLGQSVLLSENISQMINALNNQSEISVDKRRSAFDDFFRVTGYKPLELNQVLSTISTREKELLNINAFYIFFPVFLLSLFAIWLVAGLGWISWITGLFLTGLSFIILYGFSMLYRIHVQTFLDNNPEETFQSNFENSIAYWPQGLLAVVNSLTTESVPENTQPDIVEEKKSESSSKKRKRTKTRQKKNLSINTEDINN